MHHFESTFGEIAFLGMPTNPPLIMSQDGSCDAWTQNNFAQRPEGSSLPAPLLTQH